MKLIDSKLKLSLPAAEQALCQLKIGQAESAQSLASRMMELTYEAKFSIILYDALLLDLQLHIGIVPRRESLWLN